VNHWNLTIPGPIMGAVRTTQRQKWCDPRYKVYQAYKERIRLMANLEGVPNELNKGAYYRLELQVFWAGAARADLDNVIKGVLDALFKQDRRVLSIKAHANERCGKANERATIDIEWLL
jgi:Holliday junction resolvase RusA-like endonuclease